jgi:hypothetical protein
MTRTELSHSASPRKTCDMRFSFSKTLLLLCALLVLRADSCESEQEAAEKRQMEMRAQIGAIEGQLSSDVLTAAAQSVYERKAIQALEDFAEYISILGDKSINANFSEAAQALLRGLDYEHQLNVELPTIVSGQLTTVPVDQFTTTIAGLPFDALRLSVDSVVILSALENTSETSYRGTLQYTRRWHGIHAGDTLTFDRATEQREFYVAKVGKALPTDSSRTWELLLGSMANSR